MKRLMAAERKSQGNERHNVPVASLPSPPPLSPPLTPTLAVSLCAPGQVRSSGFLARSRDAPIDPRCCGFIKTFPPPSYCVCDCMFVCLSLSLCLSVSVCDCVCVHLPQGSSVVLQHQKNKEIFRLRYALRHFYSSFLGKCTL